MNGKMSFRGWFKERKCMVNFGQLGFTCELECAHPSLIADNNEHWYYEEVKEQPIIMQSIGVKDKNGKEMFEGDTVLVYPFGKSQSFLTELAWSESFLAFRFYPLTKEADERERTKDDIYEYTEDNDYEVIGNIFETHQSSRMTYENNL